MRSLKVVILGEIPLVMHCAKGDVQLRLLNVAYVPVLKLNFFSMHAVMQMHELSLNAMGVHPLDDDLSFMSRDAGPYVKASRDADVTISAAVISPGKMNRIDINELQVFLPTPVLTLCARWHAIWALRCWIFGFVFWWLAAMGRRMAVPLTVGCHPPGPWNVFSWIPRGTGLRLPAGRNT